MTNEEFDRRMSFFLENQARFDANQARFEENQERFDARMQQMSEAHDKARVESELWHTRFREDLEVDRQVATTALDLAIRSSEALAAHLEANERERAFNAARSEAFADEMRDIRDAFRRHIAEMHRRRSKS